MMEPIIEDGASDWPTFAEKARKLIEQDKVAVVFGCWTSASRKAVLPVFEELNGLLFYPVQYEGLESSPNIFYTGAEPTQQIIPGVEYLVKDLGAKSIYLLGSDYVFPRTANLIIKAQLEALGVTLAGEEYVPLGGTEFSTIISKIQEAKPDAIFNTLNGDSNVAFFKQFKDAGFTAETLPVMSVSVAEEEVRGIGAGEHRRSLHRLELLPDHRYAREQGLCRRLQGGLWRRPRDERPDRGRLLRRLSVEGHGREGRQRPRWTRCARPPRAARSPLPRPKAWSRWTRENQHTYKSVRIGKINAEGLIDAVYTSPEAVKPDPYPEEYPVGCRAWPNRPASSVQICASC